MACPDYSMEYFVLAYGLDGSDILCSKMHQMLGWSMNAEVEIMRKKWTWPSLKFCIWIGLEGLRKTAMNLTFPVSEPKFDPHVSGTQIGYVAQQVYRSVC